MVQEKRGVQTEFTMMDNTRILLRYRLPLSEIITDFFDRIKSLSQGYARYAMMSCKFLWFQNSLTHDTQ